MTLADLIRKKTSRQGATAIPSQEALTAVLPVSVNLTNGSNDSEFPDAGVTVQAEAEDLREHFEERAGILEYDGGMPRPEAELEAARITATYARNRGDLWDSLRTALVDYPALLTVLPAAPGAVDTLPPKGWLRSPCSRAGLYGGKERSPERRR